MAPFLIRFVPDPDPSWGQDPTTFVVMMVVGFVIGVSGHLVGSRVAVGVGIGLIFLATFLLPLATDIIKS